MSSVTLRRRYTGKGDLRIDVRYRESGRGPILHGGTFKSEDEAKARVRLISAQLASGLPVDPRPRKPVSLRWLYFIRMGIDGPIKIGNAVNPDRRLAALQTGNPYRLHLIAKTPWHEREEDRLHVLFRHAQLLGEWFRPVPELLAYIRCITGEDAGEPTTFEGRETPVSDPSESRVA
jgi:hypothetical protein